MTKYLSEVKSRLYYFNSYSFKGVDRADNIVVDALSKLATTNARLFGGSVYLEVLNAPSIQKQGVVVIERSYYWLTSYLDYLSEGKLHSDRILAKKVKHRSSYFCLIDGDIYRHAYFSPLLKCLVPSEAAYVL